ncbi:MAG: PKD domain-containing protein [Candidatus Aminicenantes bacterium]|nr:PKD domain-containing protein [Candidatus Aminicenantes bacterium]NIM80103.1 PKD domain-containing protein [Candidatus Aminicenantes bacterium]NIN19441.1 PKD domain-containing protein [Candidatus Aminicenantes bacterium]NIN43341.1 PKD domain-containing protein [Candidatus Aminicenantes bacterium]NIN86085.1 PKD domain-containing protein [Candidatus Aminicenantes bacterium]
MRKFLSVFIIAAFMLFASNFVFSIVQVGEEVAQRFETPHPYPGMKGVVWEKEFHWPNAGYIAIHFSEFNLAKGDYVEISSPDGRFYYTFSEKGKKVKHKDRTEELSDFWGTHIPGDRAFVRLVSKNKKSDHGFVIDKWARGYERGYIQAVMAGLEEDAIIEAVCNSDDKEWAKCYLGTTMYDESRAVCRLLIGGTSACTGWLLGSEGHVMTNNHCISTQSSASNTDYEFMAEGATCSTSCASWGACPGTVEASSGSLIQTDSSLDYTLILLPSNITGTYGYMQLRDTLPSLDERIYIPQHPSAWGKQLAVVSDTDGPYAKIYSTNEPPCIGGPGDIGYYADTAGGSSGSPVLAYDDNLVVALHHCANCPNRGVPIPPIITDLGSNLPANAIGGGGPPQPPVADFSGNPTTVEVGSSVQFTDLSTNTPTSWSWTFEGGTPSTSTAQNPTVTYNTIGTYNVTLTASNAAGSDTETKVDYITVQEVVIEYCTSSGGSQSYEYIAGVQVGDLTNNSGASAYSDFTYMTANLTAGASVNVSLTPGFPGSSYTEWWKIWIDYNVDGDFEDSGEEVFSGSGSSTVTGSFTVPSGVEAVTRMRVSMSYSTYPPVCGTFTYGEVEDYTADISGGVPPVQYTLTTNTVGNGSITLNPPGGVYDEGTVVTLTAVPDAGWQFDGWSGDLSGTQNPTTITMNSNKNVTATFSEVPPEYYTLTVTTVGNGSVTLDPPGGTYPQGTVVTLTAVPDSGWQFDYWSGDLSGSANPTTITMNSDKNVTANFSEIGTCTETVGNTTVFGSTSVSANRRAMPFTMPENGNICSVTIYHAGGSGGLILGVYDGEGAPQNRLGVTNATTINSSAGWQTINLTSPAYVAGGSTVWLAWVFQSNPGIRYQTGSPGRFQSSDTWSGGMPDPFGSGSQASYLYSIYATYAPAGGPSYGTVGNTTIFGSTSVSANRRAMPFTMPENGTIESVTMYHAGGNGGLILGVYDGEGTPQNRLGVTNATTINSSAGWQTINLQSPAFVAGGSTVWLAWVYESNPGIRYQTGSPGRYQSSDTWSGGMPDPFGSGTQTTYIYSIYGTYLK